jgi:hypothetical protein
MFFAVKISSEPLFFFCLKLEARPESRLARFILAQYTKTGENIQKLPNDHNIYEIAIKYSMESDANLQRFSILSPSKIFPKSDFWFENIPSGNPGPGVKPKFVQAALFIT